MKTSFNIIFILTSFLIFNSCSSKKDGNVSKIKTEKTIRYYYKLGTPDTKGDTTITFYNEFGKPTEERSSGTKKIYLYDKDTLLISETQYGLTDNSIWYKKNITYNESREKESIKIYTSFTMSKIPELVAGMKIFYDLNNKISERKYFGGIQYNEDEIQTTISADPNGPSMQERENDRKADSSSAKYIRNKSGKATFIYFNNDTTDRIKFVYNGKGKLISKQILHKKNDFIGSYLNAVLQNDNSKRETNLNDSSFTGTRYYYINDVLSKVEEIENNYVTQVYIYNEKEKIIEVKQYYQSEISWKMKFTYSDNGNVKDITKYNNIDEPVYIDKYEYDYY